MSGLPIRPYENAAASFHASDPVIPEVAAGLARLIDSAWPGAVVEHVGSSSVPGLPGKNVVDLGTEIAPADIPAFTDAMCSLGFGRQPGMAPFPPTRPMLTGNVVHGGASYRVHLHVMPPARRELAEQLAFREALRADPRLRDEYAEVKRQIVEQGRDGGLRLYTFSKGDWVVDALYRLGIRSGPAGVEPLAPGATIGVLGGGQLGRMLGFAARAMGYRLVILDPDPACPASAVADEVVVARYDDVEGARRLASLSDVVTYELEHVGLDAAAAAGEIAPLRPGLEALRVTQDRLAERRFLRDIGELTAPWREVRGVDEAIAAGDALGYPFRLKLPLGGYDGRSQVRVVDAAAVPGAVAALSGLEGRPLLAEQEVAFAAELSVVTARGRDGRPRSFPASRNVHDEGILVESVAPAPVDPLVAENGREITESVARAVDLVGLVTAELFQLPGAGMMINELAPRVHNSGHWTIEGAATSQFEQHVRAILGLPLGSTAARGAAAMVNLLGSGAERDARLGGMEDALIDGDAHVHVYGKRRVFERRKMGHVTVVAREADDALARARAARAALRWED